MNAKNRYENTLIVLQVLEDNISEYKRKIYSLRAEWQKECPHLEKQERFWYDAHKNEDNIDLYCIECNMYLGKK